MGRSTRRAVLARKMAAAALSFAPGSPTPRAALVELVGALREGWEMTAQEALLVLTAGDDPEAEALLMLTTGINLDRAEPATDKHAAVAEFGIWTGPRRPDDLARLITVHALVRFDGDRRRALRHLVEQREHTLVTLFARATGIEL